MTASEPVVLEVAEWSRFEVHVGGRLAGRLDYRITPGEITLVHTEIDEAYNGQGLAGTLVRSALDTARQRKLAVRPECPYARTWIERHPEYADLVVS